LPAHDRKVRLGSRMNLLAALQKIGGAKPTGPYEGRPCHMHPSEKCPDIESVLGRYQGVAARASFDPRKKRGRLSVYAGEILVAVGLGERANRGYALRKKPSEQLPLLVGSRGILFFVNPKEIQGPVGARDAIIRVYRTGFEALKIVNLDAKACADGVCVCAC